MTPASNDRIVSYLRVSTKRQGRSGLGLEGQRAAVAEFAARNAGSVVCEYVEVETGKNNHRPELARALAHAKRSQARLVVAKLDRLSRNAAFLLTLRDSGARIVACDMPEMNELTVGIMAVVAQDEARRISERTKAALAAAKARGVKLGSARKDHWMGREDKRAAGLAKAQQAAAESRRQLADGAYVDLYPVVREWHETGQSLAVIAERLNAEGHTTRRGRPWNPMQVLRVLRRAG
ncbi:MAG TPA: recombinase family protein [Candidatus Anammoximicrobium sp.]|nr:recombinase family protein [Candidatus Anammoximicrobium sp.]